MSSKIVKKNDEFSVIAGILDCYMILRLQNSTYTWDKLPFMSSETGLETVKMEDAHFINLEHRPSELKQTIELKKTKIYTISKPGLFNKVLITLFTSIFTEFHIPCKASTTTDKVIEKIKAKNNLLARFMDDEIVKSDDFSSKLWDSISQINLHKLEIMKGILTSHSESNELLKGCLANASVDIILEYSLSVLRFIFMLSGFLAIRYSVDMKTVKADTLITTIKTMNYLGIININWNAKSNFDKSKILNNQLDTLLKEERIHRAELQKKKNENKKAKSSADCEIEALVSKTQLETDSEEESDEEEAKPTMRSSIIKKSEQSTTKISQIKKLKTIKPKMEDIPNLSEFVYEPVSSTPTTNSKKKNKINIGEEISDIDMLLMIENTIDNKPPQHTEEDPEDEYQDGTINQIDSDEE